MISAWRDFHRWLDHLRATPDANLESGFDSTEVERLMGFRTAGFRTAGDPRGRLERLYRIVAFLPKYGLSRVAERLVEIERERWKADGNRESTAAAREPGSDGGSDVWTALRCAASLGAFGGARVWLAPNDSSWEGLRVHRWTGNLRLALAIPSCRRRLFVRLLRETAAGRRNGGLERGLRWRLLGLHALQRGTLVRAVGFLYKALEEFDSDPALDAQFKAAEVRAKLAYIHVDLGELKLAERLVEEGLELSRPMRNPDLSAQFYRIRALVESRRGEFDEARTTLRRLLGRLRGQDDVLPLSLALTHIAVVDLEAFVGDDREGWIHWNEARALLPAAGPLEEGLLERARGRLHGLGAGDDALRTALRCFERAESCFASIGDGHALCLYRVCLYRGHLQLLRGNVDDAAEDVLRCLSYAQDRDCLPARAAGLLLKSQLILQEKGARVETFYEEVLRDMGSIRNPRLLFRIVANLYLYSWRLGDQLELTVHHFDQIAAFREILDPPSFQRLYRRYVAQPVLHRADTTSFGLLPLELQE